MSKLSICSKLPNGHRRAGFGFGKNPLVLDVSDLTPEQLSQIENDPNLLIVQGGTPNATVAADTEATLKIIAELENVRQHEDALEAELKAIKQKLEDETSAAQSTITQLEGKLETALQRGDALEAELKNFKQKTEEADVSKSESKASAKKGK